MLVGCVQKTVHTVKCIVPSIMLRPDFEDWSMFPQKTNFEKGQYYQLLEL